MQKSEVSNRIYHLIEQIVQKTEIINNEQGPAPRIELDLLREKIRSLYEMGSGSGTGFATTFSSLTAGASFPITASITRMQNNPINNLKTAIGINEKFIFVYELFAGNDSLYHTSIEKLNSAASNEEAQKIMEGFKSEFSWDADNAAFQKLLDMVNRRFS